MVFHWSLSDCMSRQVSRTLLSILAVLKNLVVWMVSTCPLISKSSSPFNNPLVTVPRVSVTIGIIVTFMFHRFFISLARSRYSSFLFSFSFIMWSAGDSKVHNFTSSLIFFVVHYYKVWSSGWDYAIRFYVKIPLEFMSVFSWTDAELCIYHLFVWSNLNFLHNSQ